MTGVDPGLLVDWAAGRSIARSLPPPVADAGGWRVDTAADGEVARWFFAATSPAVAALAERIARPGHLIKVCGDAAALRTVLSRDWTVEATGHVMIAGPDWASEPCPAGYRIEVDRIAPARHVRILDAEGTLAANGYAAETPRAIVYDRIVTAPGHRRRGLGRAVMSALRDTRRDPAVRGLLVATDAGQALYATLGWRTIAPYATASIVG